MPLRDRATRVGRGVAVAALAATAALVPAGASGAAAAHASIFKGPGAIALDHAGHLWVADSDRFGLTEVDAATGKFIRIVREPGYTLNDPAGLTVTHDEVWVLNGGVEYANGTCTGGLVVVLSARTGQLVRTVDLRHRGLSCVDSIVSDSSSVWVSGAGGGRLVELSAATGRVERRIYRTTDHGAQAYGLAIHDGRLYYPFRNAVAERWAGSGAWIGISAPPTTTGTVPGFSTHTSVGLGPTLLAVTRDWVFATCSGGRYPFPRRGDSLVLLHASTLAIGRVRQPWGPAWQLAQDIISDGVHVWVANQPDHTHHTTLGGAVSEYDATTGAWIASFVPRDGPFSGPSSLASDGRHLFVADRGGGNVLEYSVSTRALLRVIGPPAPASAAPA